MTEKLKKNKKKQKFFFFLLRELDLYLKLRNTNFNLLKKISKFDLT